MPSLRWVAVAVVLVTGLPAGSVARVPEPEQRGTARCQGRPATIVGANRSDGSVVGTRRADVVVTDGSQRVVTRGGDDLVCVTGRARSGGPVVVLTGAGDDRLRVGSTIRREVVARLGDGDDRFESAPGYVRRRLVAARVDLGDGDDVAVYRADGRERYLAGGPGDDRLRVLSYGHAAPDGSETVASSSLLVFADGTAYAHGGQTVLGGFETYSLLSDGQLSVLGTDADERFEVTTCGSFSTVYADGGDDVLVAVRYAGNGTTDPGCFGGEMDGGVLLAGGEGDDVLVGGGGDDYLEGGPGGGIDYLDGRGGTDVCRDLDVGDVVLRCEQLE